MQAWELYIGEASNGKVSKVNKDASRINWVVVVVIVEDLKICISGSVTVLILSEIYDCNRSYLKINLVEESNARLQAIG